MSFSPDYLAHLLAFAKFALSQLVPPRAIPLNAHAFSAAPRHFEIRILMKKAFLPLLLFACSSVVLAQSTTTWKISVANQGTAGGYTVTSDLKSTDRVPYFEFYPDGGHMPAWVVRMPRGNYTITSQNAGTIDVLQCNTGKDIATNQPASSFSFRAPADGWYRLLLRGGKSGARLHDFTISSTDVKGADAVFLAGWRSIPSLHLNTFGSTNNRLPKGDAFDWIYNEVQIPEDADFTGTYAEAFGFSGGYVGIQNNGRMDDGKTNHTVIFSTWDNGDTDQDASLAGFKRSGVIAIDSTLKRTVAERFGGEGTGVHVVLNGDYWKPSHWVRFLLNVRPEEIQLADGSSYNNTIISAWYNVRGIDDQWHYISSQRMAGQVRYFGSGFNSFLEEFTRGGTSQGWMPHKAYYRRVFTRSMQGGEWFNRNHFTFGHTDGGNGKGARNDRYQTMVNYDGEQAAYMQSGGYIEPRGGNPITLRYMEPGDFIPSDETLQALVDKYVTPAIKTQDVQRMHTYFNESFVALPQSNWTIASYSSQETQGEGKNGAATLVLDGKNDTYWHTNWSNNRNGSYPHYLVFRHKGTATVERIQILNDAKHAGNQYRAKTVQLRFKASDGKWKTIGEYTLPNAETQYIDLTTPLEVGDKDMLRIGFNDGYNGTTGHMAIAEVNFMTINADKLRQYVQELFDKAGQWNYYELADVQKYLGTVKEHLKTATEKELSDALLSLAQQGKVLKYGPVTELYQLNAQRSYVISALNGAGTLVQTAQSATPSLRNVDEKRIKGALADYVQAVSPADSASAWLIVGNDNPATANDYVIYNLKTGLFLQPGSANQPATMSEIPVKVRIGKNNQGFLFSRNEGTRAFLTAHPTQALGNELKGQTSNGTVWRIVDNYSISPSADVVKALRSYFKTGKFVRPTGIAAPTLRPDAQGAEQQFDLSGRRVLAPQAGQIVVSHLGKVMD